MARGKGREQDGGGLVGRETYVGALSDIGELLDAARRTAVRSLNAIMTAAYWSVGRRIVEEEQRGAQRASYGDELLERLAIDLTARFGRGFSRRSLSQMRSFYTTWPEIRQTLSAKSHESSKSIGTSSYLDQLRAISQAFPLPWSHYVRILAVKHDGARQFYEDEALRGGWTVRQLARQIDSMFYERTVMSRDQAAVLRKGRRARPDDRVSVEEAIKDPFLLEFLDLKDEYGETEMEDALVRQLGDFLLELGGDFAFVGRQRRLRLDDTWYRIDLLFFHRRLRSLVVIDLKLGELTHADAGQMHLYLNYARERWTQPGENPPVGIILCASKGAAIARYALEGLGSQVLAAEYRTVLPPETELAAQLRRAQVELERRRAPARPRRPRRSSRAREGRLAWAGAALWSRPWPSARSPRSDTRCCASAPAR